MKRTTWSVLALALVLAGLGWPVEAQEGTVIQYFLIPVMAVENSRGPSYLRWRDNPDGLNVQWSCKDYGAIDMMICAVNADQADLDWLAAQADVYAFGQNLDEQMPQDERGVMAVYMESVAIPADWITPADTRRQAIRTITGMFLFSQRLHGITGQSPLDWGITLNTQFRNIEQQYQGAIREAFDTLGYDSSVLRDNWTLRVILKNAADQWADRPIHFGFTVL